MTSLIPIESEVTDCVQRMSQVHRISADSDLILTTMADVGEA